MPVGDELKQGIRLLLRRPAFAGSVVLMLAIGIGVNTAIVVAAPDLATGIDRAFVVNGSVAVLGALIALVWVGGKLDKERLRAAVHRHRAHG